MIDAEIKRKKHAGIWRVWFACPIRARALEAFVCADRPGPKDAVYLCP